ncbi:MAG: aminopeptidase [Pseudomonadota bacterium]|jgi:aminopeptidase N
MSQEPVRQYLKDYRAPAFVILETHLTFEIQEKKTIVTNQMRLERKAPGTLTLTGPASGCQSLTLHSNGSTLICREGSDYSLNGETLTLNTSLDRFEIEVVTHLVPSENTALMGLYQTGTGLCTQCEPEGFRNITFFLDRPDVMARYSTTIIADKNKYPILLSNGNRISKKDLTDGRHQVEWQDPFPKPSYLFAIVAGDYGVIKDSFITKSGKKVELEIYCEHGNEFQCHHALAALKRSMKWDEEAYGREYDLDQYLILAVDDFNGGAMENKGLNIFNSRLVFADTTTATDEDFERVEAVIAHEYFHNWTGNRITLRDWFQLSLKEGLTVFREQHYMSDMASEALKRIDDVELLRNRQYPEDAGPNAHPVRPESALAVDNFYTLTVYEKGAEVIRVLKQLLGDDLFKKGMNYYFDKHDGQSITIEDFLNCFEHVSKKDLDAFSRWYSQAGTPKVSVTEQYDENSKTYSLEFNQSCSPSPGQDSKLPFVIPVKLSLFSPTTKRAIKLTPDQTEIVLELTNPTLSWSLKNCEERPIASLLRGMTAPVNLEWNPSIENLEFLATHDNDGFNQWESVQKLALRELTNIYHQVSQDKQVSITNNYVTLFEKILQSSLEKPELTSRLLQLPSQDYFLQTLPLGFNPESLSLAFEHLEKEISTQLNQKLWLIEEQINKLDNPNDYSFKAMGLRQLRNTLWHLLGNLPSNTSRLGDRYNNAKSMNEQAGLMEALNILPSKERFDAFEKFEKKWHDNSLVMNKWLAWQAKFNHHDNLSRVKELSQSTHFKASNPNKVRSLYGVFATTCWRGFHRNDGKGYEFFGEKILEVDALNPSTAARLCAAFENWYRLEPLRQSLVQKVLERLVAQPKLSKNSFEILKRSLDFKLH